MDALSIGIIIFATVTALLFKFILYHKICNWMDKDLISGLSAGNSDKQRFLTEQLNQLKNDKVKRKLQHQRLTELADEFEQNR
ncbi:MULTISPECIES: hypothetical protein [Amphritea]|uniref:Uncharacterized protein n=2 Tax=Amphritea TaxID=515417 RepID=A0A1H9I1D8_9GAMM|nr:MULTISPECIES: hypothetical protein [Amphritea]MBN0987115.1 hypothetical protein [Amphritea pacifica]MBN1007879.1 hypothetical protein [Amphritea pacifica]SEQ68292.1 hypothetical protein SAMN03080615_02359 [Amphritea atlantica]